MRPMKIISVGDNVRKGTYLTHSRFGRVVNLINSDDYLISLVTKEIGAGPVNVVVDNIKSNIAKIIVDEKQIIVDEEKVDIVCEIYNSQLPTSNPQNFKENLKYLEKILLENTPAKSLVDVLLKPKAQNSKSKFEETVAKEIRNGVEKLFKGNFTEGARLIKGRGFGLTPAGDDFLAGVVLALNFLKIVYGKDTQRALDEIFEGAKGDSVFSNNLLQLAYKGLYIEKVKKLIFCLQGDDKQNILAATLDILSIGATSGADLLAGFYLQLKWLTT